jgi:hypothetical protein
LHFCTAPPSFAVLLRASLQYLLMVYVSMQAQWHVLNKARVAHDSLQRL